MHTLSHVPHQGIDQSNGGLACGFPHRALTRQALSRVPWQVLVDTGLYHARACTQTGERQRERQQQACLLGLAFAGVKCRQSKSVQSFGAASGWEGVGMGGRGREWESAGAGAGAGAGMSGGPCSRWHRWTGLGWWLPHCMIGPPNFPSYNLSTCNLPPINDLNHSASHLLPSPSHLAINHNPSLVISSPVNKVEKPTHIPFPFLCIRSVALNPPPSAIRNPLSQNKQPPRPRRHRPGLVAR